MFGWLFRCWKSFEPFAGCSACGGSFDFFAGEGKALASRITVSNKVKNTKITKENTHVFERVAALGASLLQLGDHCVHAKALVRHAMFLAQPLALESKKWDTYASTSYDIRFGTEQ